MNCPAVLLVVAPDEAVAWWCARPIPLGHPGFVLQPLVAGPGSIPVILGKQEAGQSPELAVLSAMAHGQEPELVPALFEAVASSARSLDSERATFYFDLALSAFGEAARSALEALMQSGNYEYQSEFARKYVAQGLEKGLEKGLKRGHLEGERSALITVLESRGLTVEGEARSRIQECTDLARLKRWLGQAAMVRSVQELFNRKSTSKPVARSVGPHRKARNPRARR